MGKSALEDNDVFYFYILLFFARDSLLLPQIAGRSVDALAALKLLHAGLTLVREYCKRILCDQLSNHYQSLPQLPIRSASMQPVEGLNSTHD